MSYARKSLQWQTTPHISWRPWYRYAGYFENAYDGPRVHQHYAGWLFWQWRWFTVK